MVGLKCSVNHIASRYIVVQALLLDLQDRESRFSIMLKGPKIFSMLDEHWLQLKVTSCISP